MFPLVSGINSRLPSVNPTLIAGLAFGGTGLCFYRVRGVDGICVEHLTSFSANPSHCSPSFLLLKYLLHGLPGLFTLICEHICFLLLVFFLFLHFLVVGSVR